MFYIVAAFLVWLFATGKYNDWKNLVVSGFTGGGGVSVGNGASGDW
jgi:hypothetical protein